MKALILLPLVACVSAQVLLPYNNFAPNRRINMADIYPSSQFYAQGDMGQFSFGHSSLDNTRSEVRLWNGQVLGHYTYIDPNGQPAITYYESGPYGYRVLGSNRLPEAPKYTKEVAEARANFDKTYKEVAAAGPTQSFVDYTKEVADARADFAKTYEKAAGRA
ncbi:cuticle protein 6-like [Oratosquilla oratoria]|uniref:cuticle protein 6-like n=1 Tax=Oratosquilla oratoria TaxID=337810 RepID=UPI003F7590AA